MKVNPADYGHIMYVDASGDDGFKFESDSTSCYAAAALLVAQEDLQHNLDILNQIKHIVGCKPTDEVKYSKIRRHRNVEKALSLLRDLKGKLSCYVIFKKELADDERPKPGTKTLSVVCHLMALRSLDSYSFQDGEKVLIAIDRMKHTEESPLEAQMKFGVLSDRKKPERNFTTETIFRDSKDANFLLIQIADLLCGTIREHCEQYETNADMIYFSTTCPKCKQLLRIKRGNTRILCKKGESRVAKIIDSKSLRNIMHLFPVTRSLDLADFFFTRPTKMADKNFYMFCARKK